MAPQRAKPLPKAVNLLLLREGIDGLHVAIDELVSLSQPQPSTEATAEAVLDSGAESTASVEDSSLTGVSVSAEGSPLAVATGTDTASDEDAGQEQEAAEDEATPSPALSEHLTLDEVRAMCANLEDNDEETFMLAPEHQEEESDGQASVIQEAVKPLYEIQGTDCLYPVLNCDHCDSSQIIVSEVLLHEMQTKLEALAIKGLQTVKDRAEANLEIKALKYRSREQRHRAKKAEKERDAAEKKTEGLQAELESVKQTLKRSEEDRIALEWGYQSLEYKLSTRDWEIVALKMRHDGAEEHVLIHKERVAELQHQIAGVEELGQKRIEDLQVELWRTRAESSAVKQQLDVIVKQRDKELDISRTNCQAKEMQLNTALAQVHFLEGRLKEVDVAASKKIEYLQNELTASRGLSEVLQNQLLVSKSEVQNLRQCFAVATTAEGAEDLRATANRPREEREAAMSEPMDENRDLLARIRTLEEENARLVNIEADCVVLAERDPNIEALERIGHLERSNEYLRHQLSLRPPAIMSSASLANTSTGRNDSRWSLRRISSVRSLRGSRNNALDVERNAGRWTDETH